jgi:hypothetical protein
MSDQGKHVSEQQSEIGGAPVEGGLHLPVPAQGDKQVLDLINFLEWLDDMITVKSDRIPPSMSWEDVAKAYLAERSEQ